MDSVVCAQIDILQRERGLKFPRQLLVCEETFADKIVRLGGFLEVRVAVRIKHNLPSLGAGKVRLDPTFGEVPVGMGDFRQPECRVGTAYDKQYFHLFLRWYKCGMRYFFWLMTSAIPLGNMPSAAASTLSASRSNTIFPLAATQ